MRILSQDGKFNFPYERVCLEVSDSGKIFAQGDIWGTEDNYIEVARYENEEKVRKAMEMLREQYTKLCSISTYLHGGMELFAKSISQQEIESFSIEYKNMNVFQFPTDDEVEVLQ